MIVLCGEAWAQEAEDEELLIDEVEVAAPGPTAGGRTEPDSVRRQTVSQEELDRRQARNIAESLRYSTGVRVETNCQSCGFTSVRLNGLEGAYSQILIDGVPSFSGLAGVYGLEQLPVEMVERIDVIKGGGSALYGPGAIAGVIAIETRRAPGSFARGSFTLDVVGMEVPATRAGADAAYVTEDQGFSAHLFAMSMGRDALDINGDGFSELTRQQQLAAGLNLAVQAWPGAALEVKVHGVQEARRGGDRLELPPHDAALAESIETSRRQGELRWRHTISPAFDYALTYVLSHTERRSYYGGGGDVETAPPAGPIEQWSDAERADYVARQEAKRQALGGYGSTDNPLHVGDARLRWHTGAERAQTWTLAAQVQADQVEDRYLGYDREVDATYTNMGVALEQQWAFAAWGSSTLGARLDKHSELGSPVLSPRASLKLSPWELLTLRTALSSGFRPPQVFDEDLHIETVGGSARIIENAPGLKPERSWGVTQQARATWEPDDAWSIEGGLTGYYSRLTDAFVVNERDREGTPEIEALRENRGATRTVGVEVEGQVMWRKTAGLRVGWTAEDARNEVSDEDFGQQRILRTPRQYGFAEGFWAHDGLEARAAMEVTGPMLAPLYGAEGQPQALRQTPWFFDLSLHVRAQRIIGESYTVTPLAGVRNVFNSYQRDLQRGAARDAGYVYGPSLPRSVYVGVQVGL
jgi:outer membrane receptor for ferrienterochelin and colicins